MKRAFIVLFVVCSIVGQVQSGQHNGRVIFKGTLTGPWQGHKVFLYNNITKENDSAEVVDGKFTISRPFSVPTRYMFYSTYDTKVKRMYIPFGVLVGGACTVTLKTDIAEGFAKSKVSGSLQHELYSEFQQVQETAMKRVSTALENKYGKEIADKPDEKNPQYPEFEKESQQLTERYMTPVIENLIKRHPSSYASVFVLNRFGEDLGVDNRAKLLKLLSPSVQSLYEGKYLADEIAGEKKSEVGSRVDDFTLNTPDNTPLKLGSLKGKYVLIDFWASWCGPCREEFKNLRELYSSFKDKNFEILGVSTDKNKEAWLKAIKDEKLAWPQVVDGDGENSIALKSFAVNAIPKTFLIDAGGKIIAKDLRGDQLKNKLTELLNQEHAQ